MCRTRTAPESRHKSGTLVSKPCDVQFAQLPFNTSTLRTTRRHSWAGALPCHHGKPLQARGRRPPGLRCHQGEVAVACAFVHPRSVASVTFRSVPSPSIPHHHISYHPVCAKRETFKNAKESWLKELQGAGGEQTLTDCTMLVGNKVHTWRVCSCMLACVHERNGCVAETIRKGA